MNASLNEKLGTVKWGEFRLGDLFEINPTKYYRLKNDNRISENGMIPLVSNASIDNGVMGFSNLPPLNKGNSLSCSDTTLGAETMYYQKDDYIGYQHIQALVPKLNRFNSSMETLISAVQKLVIKEVVLYANQKIETTKAITKRYW